jgi:hypothetical protein
LVSKAEAWVLKDALKVSKACPFDAAWACG